MKRFCFQVVLGFLIGYCLATAYQLEPGQLSAKVLLIFLGVLAGIIWWIYG